MCSAGADKRDAARRAATALIRVARAAEALLYQETGYPRADQIPLDHVSLQSWERDLARALCNSDVRALLSEHV